MKKGEELIDAPFFEPVMEKTASARNERAMQRGLAAEMSDRYVEAVRLYTAAHTMDPSHPLPLRYLGEVYPHHTGQWDKARQNFEAILKMPTDPLSPAVAPHGLGTMTNHAGDFKKRS